MTNPEYAQLVEFLTAQFNALHRRFDTLDGHFDTLDRRFNTIGRRLDAQAKHFREVLDHVESIYRRLDQLEQESHAAAETIRRIEALLVGTRHSRWLGSTN